MRDRRFFSSALRYSCIFAALSLGVATAVFLSVALGANIAIAAPDVDGSNAPKAGLKRAGVASGATLGQLVANRGGVPSALIGDAPPIEPVEVFLNRSGDIVLSTMPNFQSEVEGQYASISSQRHMAFYSLDSKLQSFVADLVKRADAPHVAIVAMEPETGKVLALAQKSSSISNLALHAGFPAASLFKVVTTAAAIERSRVSPDAMIRYRGGTYVLERWNYLPDPKRDRNVMSLREALGKSCNAVFGRVALNHLNTGVLKNYSRAFGFNQPLRFEVVLPRSDAEIPDDSYGLSRTAAGFGDVKISPIHAATLMSGIANDGKMPRPLLVDKVLGPSGAVLYRSKPEVLQQMVEAGTSRVLLDMMRSTTTTGTSRKEFMLKNRPVLGAINVAAKTGTLRGDSPKGLNHWFIAAAPTNNPKIALSIIVVDPRSSRARASRLGRLMIEKYLKG